MEKVFFRAGGPTGSSLNRRLSNARHEEIGTAAMSPEFGFLLFVSLLWGPTVLWLLFRTIRGLRASLDEPFIGLSDPTRRSRFAVADPEAPGGLDGSWFCASCNSLNRRGVNRCYRCRTGRVVTDEPTPGDVPVGPGVPVMAPGAARSPDDVPVGPGVPVMAAATAGSSGDLPFGPGVPVMAAATAGSSGDLPFGPGVPVMAAAAVRSPGEVVEAAVAAATPGSAPPASDTPAPPAESVVSALSPSAPVSPAICPFLGFRDDPSTRCDFADPRNLCHATGENGAPSASSRRPSITKLAGTRKPQPIGMEHQESFCLTAAHEQCARHPAREGIAAN